MARKHFKESFSGSGRRPDSNSLLTQVRKAQKEQATLPVNDKLTVAEVAECFDPATASSVAWFVFSNSVPYQNLDSRQRNMMVDFVNKALPGGGEIEVDTVPTWMDIGRLRLLRQKFVTKAIETCPEGYEILTVDQRKEVRDVVLYRIGR